MAFNVFVLEPETFRNFVLFTYLRNGLSSHRHTIARDHGRPLLTGCHGCLFEPREGSGAGRQVKLRGLVLGCIDSYDSNQIVILQGFSRSTRFAILCTAQISKFQQKFVKLFSKFCLNFCKIASFQHFFIEFCTDSDENFSEFR